MALSAANERCQERRLRFVQASFRVAYFAVDDDAFIDPDRETAAWANARPYLIFERRAVRSKIR